MLRFNDVSCRLQGKVLFSNVSFVIHHGQKVALTGANGSGKSTLLGLILGLVQSDDGEVSLQQNVATTHVAQETPSSDQAALEYVIDGDSRVRALQSAIDNCKDSDGERLANLHEEFELAGGYTINSRASTLLNGLGFTQAQYQQAVASFSGGWRMRLNLAQALMSSNELLLLDEPTNHLDLDAVIWLEQWLRQRKGSLILISHDREFLDAIAAVTLHIESRTVSLFNGNYSAFEKYRAARLLTQQAYHEKVAARKQHLQAFVDRFRAKATKARQAQSRLKMIERLGETQAVVTETPFNFAFHSPVDKPSPLIVLEDADIGYEATTILRNINLSLHSGDRIGLLGANGAGKSTLVKALVGKLSLLSGSRTPARKLSIGYFAQHQVDQLQAGRSVLSTLLMADEQLSEQQARSFLGGFGFTGEQVFHQIDVLSGGERARLALALIVHSRPNLLVLDEPTNHLDIDMRRALADALITFEGALLVISHDRTMLRMVVDELLLVSDQQLTRFEEDLDGYARWLAKQRQRSLEHGVANDTMHNEFSASGVVSEQLSVSSDSAGTDSAKGNDRRLLKREKAQKRAVLAPLNKEVQRCEMELDRVSSELEQIRESLGDEAMYNENNKHLLTDLLSREVQIREAVASAEERLIESMEALERASLDLEQ
ncbi:MAG: ATP-binding cassette domain-containing protein [Granulosicoccus sp.]|nr:ATP-binding cassette domain-containing protein [Granulosicoccus sp.]